MISYKFIKITIYRLGLAKAIINIKIRYYGLLEIIISNRKSLFISKFCLLLCFFSNMQ